MRRRARRQLHVDDDVDDMVLSWAVLVEADSDGWAQVIATGAELDLQITSASLASVLAAVVQAAQRARGSALLRVVEPGATSSLVVTRDGQVVAAAPALAELDVAVILTDPPSRRPRQALIGEDGGWCRCGEVLATMRAGSVIGGWPISSWVGVGARRTRER